LIWWLIIPSLSPFYVFTLLSCFLTIWRGVGAVASSFNIKLYILHSKNLQLMKYYTFFHKFLFKQIEFIFSIGSPSWIIFNLVTSTLCLSPAYSTTTSVTKVSPIRFFAVVSSATPSPTHVSSWFLVASFVVYSLRRTTLYFSSWWSSSSLMQSTRSSS